MKTIWLSLLPIALILLACTAPASEPPAVDDTAQKEADIQAINKVNELWDAAALKGDVEGILNLITDDFIRLEPNRPAIVGKEEYRGVLTTFHNKYRTVEGKDTTAEIRLAGDWAYVRGGWTGTVVPKEGGEPVEVTGKWIDIRERQADGTWKISRASVNPDHQVPWASE